MFYISHRRFRGKSLTGKRLNLPYGTRLETHGDFLVAPGGELVCYKTSEIAKLYFARDDDGRGLERGALTYAIAYSRRVRYSEDGRQQRFTDEEIRMLRNRWGRFLRPHQDVILFNEDFFAAEPEVLQELADALKIKIRR